MTHPQEKARARYTLIVARGEACRMIVGRYTTQGHAQEAQAHWEAMNPDVVYTIVPPRKGVGAGVERDEAA